MIFSDLRIDTDDVHAPDDASWHTVSSWHTASSLRLLSDCEVPAGGELHPAPPCVSCFESMAPVGASGWWCDPCQAYQ